MAANPKAPKKKPVNALKRAKAAFSSAVATKAVTLTKKMLQDAFARSFDNQGSPDHLVIDDHTMDAFKYAMTGILPITFKTGDWFMIGDNIYEIRGVYQGSLDSKNIETGAVHKIDKYSKKIIPVPKGNPAMLRTLYGR